jgi:hypothetical protein
MCNQRKNPDGQIHLKENERLRGIVGTHASQRIVKISLTGAM